MRTLVWSAAFVRALKRAVRRQPELRARVERTLQQLAEDPFHPTLHSHKLKGELVGAWACTVDYDNRRCPRGSNSPFQIRYALSNFE